MGMDVQNIESHKEPNHSTSDMHRKSKTSVYSDGVLNECARAVNWECLHWEGCFCQHLRSGSEDQSVRWQYCQGQPIQGIQQSQGRFFFVCPS